MKINSQFSCFNFFFFFLLSYHVCAFLKGKKSTKEIFSKKGEKDENTRNCLDTVECVAFLSNGKVSNLT